jgi:Sulfotransferase family
VPGGADAIEAVEARLVWILGSPRSGSTWLANMLAADPRAILIDEPTIGVHLAVQMPDFMRARPVRVPPDRLRLNDLRAELPSYFFSSRYETAWRPPLRRLVLERFAAELDEVGAARSIDDPIALIKEPDGSQAADLLMSLLPRSRMIFLLRDGRDVIDSEVDGLLAGGWVAELVPEYTLADDDRLAFVNARAHAWLCRTQATRRAYAEHPSELRAMVRYEDLVADAGGELARLASWLALDLDADAIETLAERTAFERIDPKLRGRGRFARAAEPGLWRQNLSDREQELIEEIIGAELRELGYR